MDNGSISPLDLSMIANDGDATPKSLQDGSPSQGALMANTNPNDRNGEPTTHITNDLLNALGHQHSNQHVTTATSPKHRSTPPAHNHNNNNTSPCHHSQTPSKPKTKTKSKTAPTPTPPPYRTTATASSPLFKLPGELRNRIYRYALHDAKHAIELTPSTWASHQPALLRASTQLRAEALPIFYLENVFAAEVRDWSARVQGRLRDLCAAHGLRLKHRRHYFVGAPDWGNLVAWLREVFDGRSVGVSDCVGKVRGMERKIVGVMFLLARQKGMACRCEGCWGELERVLLAQRELLGMGDPRWLV